MALPNEAPIPRNLIASLRVIFVIACSSRANLDLTAEYISSNTHFSNRKIAGFENRVLSVCFHEAPHRLENFFRMVTMRRVAALGQEQYFDRGGDLSLHRLHLFHRSVLVVLSLDDEDGNLDLRQVALEIPRAKPRVEPGSIPSPESSLDILAVVLGELLGKVGGEKVLPRLLDALEPDLLRENVGRFEDQTLETGFPTASRVDDRDRRAIAVPHQNGFFFSDRAENLRRENSFIVHVCQRARQLDGIRAAISQTTVRKRAKAGRLRKLARKVAPLSHAAQSFMEKNKRRRLLRWRPPPRVLQSMSPRLEVLLVHANVA